MKAEININHKATSFEGSINDLDTLLKQPKVSWSYKYIQDSDGWLNICSDADGTYHVGWGLSPRQDDESWEWLNEYSYATYEFNTLAEAIEYADKY